MNLLLTGAASPLGRALTAELDQNYTLRLTDRIPLEEKNFVQNQLDHDEATDQLVAGIDAIVHPLQIAADSTEAAWLDACTRCTYNLLWAAAQAQVKEVILLSSLDLFLPYDEDMTVGEEWRPRPSCRPEVLGPHLGEFIAKEFSHRGALEIMVLRLGHLIAAEEAPNHPYDPMWLALSDAAKAVAGALEDDLRSGLFHIQSHSDRARFSSTRAQGELNFKPQHNFEDIH